MDKDSDECSNNTIKNRYKEIDEKMNIEKELTRRQEKIQEILRKTLRYLEQLEFKLYMEVEKIGRPDFKLHKDIRSFREILPRIFKLLVKYKDDVTKSNLSNDKKNKLAEINKNNIDSFNEIREKFSEISNKPLSKHQKLEKYDSMESAWEHKEINGPQMESIRNKD